MPKTCTLPENPGLAEKAVYFFGQQADSSFLAPLFKLVSAKNDVCYPSEVLAYNILFFLICLAAIAAIKMVMSIDFTTLIDRTIKYARLDYRVQRVLEDTAYSFKPLRQNIARFFGAVLNLTMDYLLYFKIRNSFFRWMLLIITMTGIAACGVWIEHRWATFLIGYGFFLCFSTFVAWTIDELDKLKYVSPDKKFIRIDNDLTNEMLFSVTSLILLMSTLMYHVNLLYKINGEPIFLGVQNQYSLYMKYTVQQVFNSIPIASDIYKLNLISLERGAGQSAWIYKAFDVFFSILANIIIVGSITKIIATYLNILSSRDERMFLELLGKKQCEQQKQRQIFNKMADRVLRQRRDAIRLFEDVRAGKYPNISNKNGLFATLVETFFQEHIDNRVTERTIVKKVGIWEGLKDWFSKL